MSYLKKVWTRETLVQLTGLVSLQVPFKLKIDGQL